MIINFDFEKVLEKAVDVLKSGGVIMHPTETCYGLACNALNENALRKLYALKEMPFNKPISILVSDFDMALKYGEFDDFALTLSRKYWPGPLSIVVKRTNFLPEFLNIDDEFISMRISADLFSCELVRKFGNPITTTSANLSGENQMYKPDFDNIIVKKVDLVIDKGLIPDNKPSTIVKINNGVATILRQGDLFISEINS
jgi:L-threonylcarbamoyladenylate synthase